MITIKSKHELDRMRQAGKIVRETLALLVKLSRPGVKTSRLDHEAENYITSKGARPAFKGYRGFPASICTSVNEVIVHGIPGKDKLKDGDILSVDVGVELGGYYADAAVTLPIGAISPSAEELLSVTRESLSRAIGKARAGMRLSDISNAVQAHVEPFGFSVVRDFVGHGIGSKLHEEPEIPNFGPAGNGPLLKSGMTFALEPMVNEGQAGVEILSDGWTAVTRDRKLSAHFEHTICIRDGKAEILT